MVDISIVGGGYKLTYNWGIPHCMGKSPLLRVKDPPIVDVLKF